MYKLLVKYNIAIKNLNQGLAYDLLQYGTVLAL